jgi:hypothetical protein
MTDDIVKRLRAKALDEDTRLWPVDDQSQLLEEAADEIERLRKELALAQARITRLEGLA